MSKVRIQSALIYFCNVFINVLYIYTHIHTLKIEPKYFCSIS